MKKTSYRIKRYYIYALITIIGIGMPFVTFSGKHIFLLSFDKKELQLLGTAFDMQELYLMPFLLMLLFIGIFTLTSILGRAWCGWGCPQSIFRTIYRDLIETKLLGLRKISNKQKNPDLKSPKNMIKKIIGILIWAVLALLAASNFMWYFVPPQDFFPYISDPSNHMLLIGFVLCIAAFLIYDVTALKENFCAYICPYCRVQSVLFDNDTIKPVYSELRGGKIFDENKKQVVFTKKDLSSSENECITCQKCVTVCPAHIDIRAGMQLECINCLECVDACTSVMGKLKKPSLVRWTSSREIEGKGKTKALRVKTLMYFLALLIVFALLVFMGSKKEHMLLNINKTTQIYKIRGKSVSNNFVFLFQNTDTKTHTYKLKILNYPSIKIHRFKSMTLKAGELRKKVIILSTSKKLVDNNLKDVPLAIILKAYAIDDPKRVEVTRKTVFIFPRADEFK